MRRRSQVALTVVPAVLVSLEVVRLEESFVGRVELRVPSVIGPLRVEEDGVVDAPVTRRIVVRGRSLPNQLVPEELWTEYRVHQQLEVVACRCVTVEVD